MKTFMAVYRGNTVADSQLVTVTVDNQLIASVVTALLERDAWVTKDPVLSTLAAARREALQRTLEALRD